MGCLKVNVVTCLIMLGGGNKIAELFNLLSQGLFVNCYYPCDQFDCICSRDKFDPCYFLKIFQSWNILVWNRL